MISPFRGDVVVTAFVLAVPVLLLALRGEFTAQEVATRLLWCLAAGWAAVTVVRLAGTAPAPRDQHSRDATTTAPDDAERAPAA